MGAIAAILCGALGVPVTSTHAVSDPHRSVSAGGSRSAARTVSQRHNIAPSPNYFEVCAGRGRNNAQCISEELAAIRNARRHDHRVIKRAVILPDNYTHLSVAEQTFVIMNLERVDRGIRPIVGLVPKLNGISHLAAVLRVDPLVTNLVGRLLGIRTWRSIWAGDLGPLASDYDWMYYDGYSPNGSINIDCQRPTESGCWGHRHNILGGFGGLTPVAGAGTAKPVGASIAALNAGITGRLPHFTYTWQDALNHGANGHHIVTP